VPVFFVVVRRLFKGSDRQRRMYAHTLDSPNGAPAAPPGGTAPAAGGGHE